MCFLELVEAVNGLFPVANKGMNKKTLDCVIVISCDSRLDSVFFICLNDSHKADNMSVNALGYGNGMCAVAADYSRNLNDIVVCHERKRAVVFDVLYYAQKPNNEDVIDEIGQKEGELIRQYRPLLNTQIPKAEDWRKWKVKPINAEEVLKLLLDE